MTEGFLLSYLHACRSDQKWFIDWTYFAEHRYFLVSSSLQVFGAAQTSLTNTSHFSC